MPGPHPLRLDRSRYFSSVHGDFDSAVRFYQDGLAFDAHGHLCVEHCDAAQRAAADAKAPRKQMTDDGEQRTDDPSSVIRPPSSDLAEGEVNLELWAKGETRYLPAEVFAAIRERYSKSVTTFADAIEFLVNDVKLVRREQASPALLAMGGVTAALEEA
jgi:hypothetical protein